jgi:hypothetical protein
MAELIIILSLFAALAVGLSVNARWSHSHPGSGLEMGDLVAPITTISAILLAFLMVEALSSHGRARDFAGVEARIVDESAEAAVRLDDPALSRAYQASLICYARSVTFQEWPSMAVGGDRSAAVGVWTGEIDELLGEIHQSGDDGLDRLIDFESDRIDARLARLGEADPSLPSGLNWLMLASVIVSIFGLAAFMKHDTGRVHSLAVVLVFGALIGGTLIMIGDLDRPFAGFNRIEPTAMTRSGLEMAQDFAIRYPSAALPCDDKGIALANAKP